MTGVHALCAAVVLAACSQRDAMTPRTPIAPKSDGAMFPVSPAHVAFDSAPDPDVDAAVDASVGAEAAALKRIEAIFPADDWPRLRAKLVNREPNRIAIIKATGNPQLSELIARYYEARYRSGHERSRQRAVHAARARGAIIVVVALGEPSGGAVAEVHRRPANNPSEVIVLGPGARPEVLGAALETLELSRARFGDDLEQRLIVSNARTADTDSSRLAHLTRLMEQLRSAQPRHIEGVGTMKAINLLARSRAEREW